MATQRNGDNAGRRRTKSSPPDMNGGLADRGQVAERDLARLRRSVKRFLKKSPSDEGIAALREGLEEHRRFMEAFEAHLESRRSCDAGRGHA